MEELERKLQLQEQVIKELREANALLKQKVALLEERNRLPQEKVNLLVRRIFRASSEKYHPLISWSFLLPEMA